MKPVRSLARFLVNETKYIAGTNAIAGWWSIILRQFAILRLAKCPSCMRGRLHPFSIDEVDHVFLGCSQCDHFHLKDFHRFSEADPWAAESRDRLRDLLKKRFLSMGDGYFDRLRWQSRIFFGAASLGLLAILVLIIFDAISAITLLTAVLLVLCAFVRGLRASYLYWQIRRDRLFSKGAIKSWWKEGVWLI